MNIENIKEQIIQKAWRDEKFKEALLKDPKTMIQEEFHISIPDNIKLGIVEETEEQLTIVIPAKPALPNSLVGFWFIKPQKAIPNERPV